MIRHRVNWLFIHLFTYLLTYLLTHRKSRAFRALILGWNFFGGWVGEWVGGGSSTLRSCSQGQDQDRTLEVSRPRQWYRDVITAAVMWSEPSALGRCGLGLTEWSLPWRSTVAFTYLNLKSTKCLCLIPAAYVGLKNLVLFTYHCTVMTGDRVRRRSPVAGVRRRWGVHTDLQQHDADVSTWLLLRLLLSARPSRLASRRLHHRRRM